MICLELDGLYPWSKFECLDKTLTDNDISCDGVHPTINGIKTWWIKFGTVVLNNLGSPTLTSIYLLWTNYPLTLTFYPPAAQRLLHFTSHWTNYALTLTPFYPLQPTLTSIYLLWTNYPLTLTFYPPAAQRLLHFTSHWTNYALTLTPFYPLQPTLTWQFQSGVIPEKSSHCSPLLHGNFSQGLIPQKSSKVPPPTLTYKQMGGF